MPASDPRQPLVENYLHDATGTYTHVAYDRPGGAAAIIDPVLDYEPASARTSTTSADEVLAFVSAQGLDVQWILETHAHADHLSAGGYLREALGAPLAIGAGIVRVQARFKALFGLGEEFAADGRQFDRLLQDGDSLPIGEMSLRAMATPGHTDDSLTYLLGDAAFVGDTLFAPDTGTARCDFPGGDAHRLYGSIRRILSLAPDTRIYLCHDYPPAGRAPAARTTVRAQLDGNVHVGGGVPESEFVAMRQKRDATLPAPRLILPSLQVNIRGGQLPDADANGIRYLRLPLNQLGSGS